MSDTVVAVPVATVAAPREIKVVAEKMVSLAPTYAIRKTDSKTFLCMSLAENEALNWKKGLVYLTTRYSKGVNLELWLYSTKGGAHLAEYKDQFKALASDTIKCEPCGLAVKLRLSIPDGDTDEVMTDKITAFLAAIEPTVSAVREKVVVVVSPKKTAKAKAVVPETPAPAPAAELIPEDPALPTELIPENTPAPAQKNQKNKKGKK